MKYIASTKIIEWIDRYLEDPRLDREKQLRKRWAWIWMVVTFIFVLLSIYVTLFIWKLWALSWFGFLFLLGYGIGFPLYRQIKRFDLVINILFTVFTTGAMFAMLQSGGLTTSLGYVFIGMNCAMGSILAGNIRWTIGMFIWYCFTILIVGVFQSSLTTPEYITPQINTLSFVGLTFWINACILFIVLLFMKDKSRYEKSETDKLRKIDEAKTKLFTNVSHEFRTPLTVIQGVAEQMEKHNDRWMKDGPEKIKAQSQVLLRLVNQMLDIAKIEANEMQLNLIHGDICQFVKIIAGSFQSLAENAEVKLMTNQNKEPIFTDYDPDKIMHAISNLISNAIKFSFPGGVVSVDVKTELSQNKETVCILISDNGRGIPKASVSKIFERFYQAPDNNNQTSGTGLGLSVAYEMIKLMNGDITVKSKVGKGTSFKITLPITKTAEKVADNGISVISSTMIHTQISKSPYYEKNNRNKTANEPEKKPLLLIVEDNGDVVEYLQSILNTDYNIKLAPNGKAALEKAKEIIPDLILSDIMMPEMDGFEMLEQLKSDFRTDHIPVVILTARGDFESKMTGFEYGADHYLIKPFNEKELLLKLNNLLELRRKMQKHLGGIPLSIQQENTSYNSELLFLKKINALIEKEMVNEDFGINEICSLMNMSRAQLYRKFSALTNNSIGRYLRLCRLYKAKDLLENKGKNVTEAAFESGFKNLSHFSTCFHEEFGIAPNTLIQQQRS